MIPRYGLSLISCRGGITFAKTACKNKYPQLPISTEWDKKMENSETIHRKSEVN